jgi:DNA polymerase III alpha subunit (gram-positive type)
MIKLKDILAEAKLYSFTIPEVLEKFLKFDGKTIILFDTETVGLEPNTSYIQITQIAGMAFDGASMQLLGEYSKKINIGPELSNALNDPNSQEAKHLDKEMARKLAKYGKPDLHPKDALKMTGYESGDSEKVDEKQALIEFEQFINQYENVVLVAHNATFDMKTIQTRRRIHGLPPMKRVPVLDTVQISRFFFIPALQAAEKNPEAAEMLTGLLAKTKYKSYSSTLGKLANIFKIKMDGWHDAREDIMMLFQVLKNFISYLEKNKQLDIRAGQSTAAKRFRKSKF